MTNEIFTLPGSAPLIDIHELAHKIGLSHEQTRSAGRALFTQLSGDDLDLTQALIRASAMSGSETRHILDMVGALAAEFAKPVADKEPGLGDQLGQIGSAASEKIAQLAESAKERLADIDFDGAKEKALDVGQQAYGKVSDAFKRAREKIQKD